MKLSKEISEFEKNSAIKRFIEILSKQNKSKIQVGRH